MDGDYVVDEKHESCSLTESGVRKAETWFGVDNLSDADNMTLRHYIDQAIKAHGFMHRDIDYIVKDGEVIIVDEFTGRLMYGPPLTTTACTRPSRPRKALTWPPRARRSRPSPSRIISACTKSWPV